MSGEIRALLEKRGVIAFREINLADEQQVAFTRTLGTIVEEGQGSVTKITMDPTENDKAGYLRVRFLAHRRHDAGRAGLGVDHERTPAIGNRRRYGISNTYAAYEDLPQQEKAELDKTRVVHTLEATQRYVYPEPTSEMLQGWQRYADNELPLVWKHRSGRKSLVIGSTASHIVGMDRRASAALLCRLREWPRSRNLFIAIDGRSAIWSFGTTRGPCIARSPIPWTAAV